MGTTQSNTREAKQFQHDERQRVFRATGRLITDGPPYLIHCPRERCTFVGSARTDGRAVSALCNHLVNAHMWPKGDA